MRTARLCLLLLLVLLIPVRGTFAATLLCPVAGGVDPAGRHSHHDLQRTSADATSMAMSMSASAHASSHGPADPEQAAADRDVQPGSGITADTCHLCAAFCSLTPVARVHPAILPPQESVDAVFALLSPQPPNYQADGPERPPRTV